MKNIIILVVLSFALIGCVPRADEVDQRTVNQQQTVYTQNQPVPVFDWSQDRDTFIQIYKAKNEARNTWSVVTAQGTGQPIWMCPSVGFPIPADSQLTNPVQALGSGGAVIEQAEPNGLFSSKNTDATYVLCVMSNGDISPVYTEQKVTTFPFPVQIKDGSIQMVQGGQSTIKIDLKNKPN